MKVADNQIMNQKLDDLYKKYGIDTEEKKNQSLNFMEAIKDLIEVCGDDPNRQGFEETPYRVLKAHLE
ncbi:hypothetical protein, partial [Salmonella sp. SKLX063344]|uniref:hypothetical protein n=1 Tax=Salmonella sp. SKLX063344 TaxID=3159946 RepID=UPI00397D3B6E